MSWRLRRIKQCAKCPWRKDVDPHTIPNGYTVERHRALRSTIADADNPAAEFFALISSRSDLQIMACHETQNSHCIGWLANQLGDGHNLMLRLQMRDCANIDRIKVVGEQHARFEDTLPGLQNT